MKRGLSRVASEVVAALEGERWRVAKELHDFLCPTLTGMALVLESLSNEDVLGHEMLGNSAAQQKVARLRDLMRAAVREANLLNEQLAPLDQDRESLVRRLDKLTQATRRQLPCELIVEEGIEEVLPSLEVRTAFYRIAQEAVAHAMRQPEVAHICIHLYRQRQAVALEVTDDASHWSGLERSMIRFYAAAIGARLTIKNTPQEGTAVVCSRRLEPELPGPS